MAVRPITLSEIYQIARNSYDDIWAIAKAYGRDVKIYLHWTAGYYDQFFYNPKTGKMDYHIAIDGEGNIFTDCDDFSEVRSHTWRRNSGSIGITLNAAVGASPNPAIGLGKCAPTAAQIESMSQVITVLANALDLTIDQQRVMTHGEAADNKDGYYGAYGPSEQYGPETTCERWDIYLWHDDGTLRDGGDIFRGKANFYRSQWKENGAPY